MPADNMAIPTVDLSPFFKEEDDENGRKEATRIVRHACENYGFFRILNHGVPLELMQQAIELSKAFFDFPDEEKLKSKPVEGSEAPLPAGYARQPEHSSDKNEYLLMFNPQLGYNVYPTSPPVLRGVLDECFSHLSRTASLVQDILNGCMGLPSRFLKEYNNERRSDILSMVRYFPATETENIGISEHQDGSCLSFVFQDDVGGLQVLKDGEWLPAHPIEGTIIVNIGDIIQVLSNNKMKSAMHRVVRGRAHRHSFAFFYNLDPDEWVEPLPEFTTDAGEEPKYRRFLFKEYLQQRMRNKTHPPSRPQDVIHISHYAISA